MALPLYTSPYSWMLLGIILLSSGPVTRTLQQQDQVVAGIQGLWGAADFSSFSSNRQVSRGGLRGCSLCTSETSAAAGHTKCRCREYKYMQAGKVNKFYNIDQCTSVLHVPNFTLTCSETVLEISLSNNRVGTIGAGAFRGLSFVTNKRYLSELKLVNISVNQLDTAAFEGIKGTLDVLDLGHNRLKTLPDAIVNLNGLKRLHLSDNELTLSSIRMGILSVKSRVSDNNRNHTLLIDDLKIIDLSNNGLEGVPDLLPLTPNSSQLEELRLHGNPISDDLSTFVDLLAKHKKLQKLTWPLHTVTCSCATMVNLAINIYSDFTLTVIYPREQQSGEAFQEWGAVTCDAESVRVFIDRPIGVLSDEEVRRECWDWYQKNMKRGESIAAASTQTSGYAVIKQEGVSSGCTRINHPEMVLYALTSLVLLSTHALVRPTVG